MTVSPSASTIRLGRVVVIGGVLPAVYVAIDTALASHALLLLMAALTIEVGLTGVLCGRFIEPPWLRWLLYAWVWLLLDCMVIPFALLNEDFSSFQLPIALLSAQLGLATIFTFLGEARRSIRWAVGAVCIAGICVPVVISAHEHSAPVVMFLIQTLSIAALCSVLRWRGYRLMIPTLLPAGPESTIPPHSATTLSGRQFGIRDVLLWTTSLAVLLGIARAVDFAGAWLAAAQWAESELRSRRWRRIDELSLTASDAILTAMVFIVALWAALGENRRIFRWSMLALFSLAAGFAFALLDYKKYNWTPPGPQTLLNSIYRAWFISAEKDTLVRYCLASGLLFAALLIYRAIGYRLYRPLPQPFAVSGPEVRQVIAHAVRHG
jgi:hypothetical protein